jgi:hypothetical protein
MYTTVGGGYSNTARLLAATVSGGWGNEASGMGATVGGGTGNTASAGNATVGGGTGNSASGGNATTVGGGTSNSASGGNATVGGGFDNTASGDNATVGGGSHNRASGYLATVPGGYNNLAQGDYSSVGGGYSDTASGQCSTVPGGVFNLAQGDYSFSAGCRAKALHNGAFVWGDYTAADFSSTAANQFLIRAGGGMGINLTDPTTDLDVNGQIRIRGGSPAAGKVLTSGADGTATWETPSAVPDNDWTLTGDVLYTAGEWGIGRSGNMLYGTHNSTHIDLGVACTTGTAGENYSYSTVGGGHANTAGGGNSTVGGGCYNTASGSAATVPGGYYNLAQGNFSFAAGCRAKALHDGAFVWGDGTLADFSSTAVNQFRAQASGGVWFYTNAALTTGVTVAAGGGAWSSVSDRDVKRNIRPVDGADMLEKLARLEISRWSFKTQDESIEHIGPMAQDFYELFAVGEDDKHISTIDPDGIALATIKELYARNLAQQKTIDDLRAELAQMKSMLEQLVHKSDNTEGAGYSQK